MTDKDTHPSPGTTPAAKPDAAPKKTAPKKGGGKKVEAPANEASTPADPPAWQAPDYCGPITAGQAAWRHANIKPAAAGSAK